MKRKRYTEPQVVFALQPIFCVLALNKRLKPPIIPKETAGPPGRGPLALR